MASLSIYDEDGDSFVTNRGEYRMPHPSRAGLIFEPGQSTKVNVDSWIKSQPVLAVTDMYGADIVPDAPASAVPEAPVVDQKKK